MSKILITGSSTGVGALAAQALIKQSHEVVLHARNEERKKAIMVENPGATQVIVGNLSNLEETKNLACQANKVGPFDVVIHNAGVFSSDEETIEHVNLWAPYVLTALIEKPKRLVYISSNLHQGAQVNIDDLGKGVNYSVSKKLLLMLMKYVARQWPGVIVNGIHPGWVPTKIGGSKAPDSIDDAYKTYIKLAVSNDPEVLESGYYYFQSKRIPYDPEIDNQTEQEALIAKLAELTKVNLSKL